MKLAEIAKIDSGYHFRGRIESDPEGTVAVIQTKDFSDDLSLNHGALVRFTPETKVDAYLVNAGDVVFLSRGQHPWAAVLDELSEPAIVPSSFYILRADRNRVLPGYLGWFLNEASTTTSLRSMMRGSNIPFISKSDLRELQIPLPDLRTQENIVRLSHLAASERRLMRELASRRKALIDAICTKLAESSKQ